MNRVISLLVFWGSFVGLFASAAQVEFTGELEAVAKESDEMALLAVAVTADFNIPVKVTEVTEIRDDNDQSITFLELRVGAVLEIEGLVTQQWILAQEIKVIDEGFQFGIKGKIENIDAANREIQVLGVIIQVPVSAEIEDEQGASLAFSDLELDQFVEVEGNASDPLVASEVEVRSPDRAPGRVKFEGTIVSIEGSELQVEIEGVGPVLVRIVSETKIAAVLALGVVVQVSATFNDDLSVQANRITAKEFLQLVPNKLEMSFNETHTVQAILSETLDNDVSLDLISLDPAVAGPSVPVLVIPAGEMSASFEVTSASIEGETLIQASLGSETATVEVQVEEQHQQEELGVYWQPEWIEIAPNESKSVQLVLSQPAPLDFVARLTLKEGPYDLVEFPHEVHFPLSGGHRLHPHPRRH